MFIIAVVIVFVTNVMVFFFIVDLPLPLPIALLAALTKVVLLIGEYVRSAQQISRPQGLCTIDYISG